MKVSINSKFIEGPYGGGVKFANFFRDFLLKNGVDVVNDLEDDDIDIIFNINPFPHIMRASAYHYINTYVYKLKHPKTIIISRINNSDEGRGSKKLNDLFVDIGKHSDCVVYISEWLKNLFRNRINNKNSFVKYNGGDKNIFNYNDKIFYQKGEKLKIVTHHWSPNFNKGHDIYQRLDELLDDEYYRSKFEFTYIGNYPKDLKYKNVNIISPLSGKELANELKKHHIYLTAARNEGAGMHHIEGALCGLPVLYINSGGIPEYCNGFGVEFNENNFGKKLEEINENYDLWSERMERYDRTADKMNKDYYRLFLELYKRKEEFKFKKNKIIRLFLIVFKKSYLFIFIFLFKVKRKIKLYKTI